MSILYLGFAFLDYHYVDFRYLNFLVFTTVLFLMISVLIKKGIRLKHAEIQFNPVTKVFTFKAAPHLTIILSCICGLCYNAGYFDNINTNVSPKVDIIEPGKNKTVDSLLSLLLSAKDELKRDKDSIAQKTYYKYGLIKGDSDYLENRIKDLEYLIHQKK